MEELKNYDEMVTALLEEKSLKALVYLIDNGRELEFDACGNTRQNWNRASTICMT